jgi:two-component system chemotaxis response regulator CheB
MPPHFTDSLARRLDSKSNIAVKEAKDGDIIQPGNAYIAEGGKQMYLKNASKLVISDEPEGELYKPSVNVLFDSVHKYHKNKALPMIMTGMGHDGGDAVARMKKTGCHVVAQSIESSIAIGMPETLIKAKLADEIYDLDLFADAIISFFR